MPNILFMSVQFLHLAALAIWVGGIVIIGKVVAPSIFESVSSREEAGMIVGLILFRFENIVYYCIVLVVVTTVIKFFKWENINPWILLRYTSIFAMVLLTVYSSSIVSPKMRRIKQQAAKAGSKTGSAGDLPEFQKLHKLSVVCMITTGALGMLTLFLA